MQFVNLYIDTLNCMSVKQLFVALPFFFARVCSCYIHYILIYDSSSSCVVAFENPNSKFTLRHLKSNKNHVLKLFISLNV